LGDKLGVRRIVVPEAAGVGSAVGFLLAPVAYEVARSRHEALERFDPEAINALSAAMREEAEGVVRQAAPEAPLTERRQAYMRYAGQGHEIPVGVPVEPYGRRHRAVLQDVFENAYGALYGRRIDGVGIEILSWTLELAAPAPPVPAAPPVPDEPAAPPAVHAWQSLWDPDAACRVSAAVYRRADLSPGCRLAGPALGGADEDFVGLGQGVLGVAGELADLAAKEDGAQGHRRDDQQHQHRQLHRRIQQQRHPADGRCQVAQGHGDVHADRILKHRGVRREAVEQLAGAALIKEADLLLDQVVVEVLPQPGHDPLARHGEQVGAQRDGDPLKQKDHAQKDRRLVDHVAALGFGQGIDHDPDPLGIEQPHAAADEQKDRPYQEGLPLGLGQGQQTPQRGALALFLGLG